MRRRQVSDQHDQLAFPTPYHKLHKTRNRSAQRTKSPPYAAAQYQGTYLRTKKVG